MDTARPGGRERRLATVRVLLRRARSDAPSPLRRTVCAALARASDALVREEIFEVSDVHVGISLALIVAILIICAGVVWWIFKTGYRIKP